MSFLGPVTTPDGQLVRPHDIEVTTQPAPQAHQATVDRLTSPGFQAGTCPRPDRTWLRRRDVPARITA
jgi:hypothetical protein